MLPSSSRQTELGPDRLRRRSLNYGGKKIYAHKRKCEKGKGRNARTKDENKKWAPNNAAIRERAGTKYG
jgi:hypothetical protein